MFCVKCGHQLNDGEEFCTNCGNPVSDQEEVSETSTEEKEEVLEEKVEETEPVTEKKVEETEPVTEEKVEETEPVTEEKVEETEPVIEEKVEETEPVKDNPSPSKSGNQSAKVGGIIFAVILGVGIIAWIVLTLLLNSSMKKSNKEEVVPTPSPSESPKPSVKPSPKPTNNKKTASYAGYQFSYPSTFTTKDLNESGFLFINDDVAFTVLVDFTHSFDDYEQYSIDLYGEEDANESHVVIGGRIYSFFYQKTEDLDYYPYVYYTESYDGDVFIGQFSMIDHSSPSIDDIQVIDDILRTGEFDFDFTKEDDYDYGKDEIHFPEFDNYFFE